MRNWKQEVSTRLDDLTTATARHALIVEEVAEHLEDRYRSLLARGLAAGDAETLVMKELDETDVLKRELRQIERRPPAPPPVTGQPGGRRWLEGLWYDLRYAARTLRKSPGFTAVAVLTLSLGVGANTALFTVVNTVMLRPLPFPEADRLVRFWESNPAKGWPTFSVSHPTFLDWRAQNRSFERIAAQTGANFTMTTSADAAVVRGFAVTSDLLPVLGLTPQLGRNFRADEDRPGGNTRVALLTHGFWQRRFAGNPAIVGTTISLDGQPYEVIGVMAEPFAVQWGGPQLDLLVPLAPNPARNRSDHRLLVVGRLKPGVTLEAARDDMKALAAQIAKAYPGSNDGWTVALSRFYDWLIPAETRESLLVMLGAVGLVLLIACGNVASLLLARASSREREISVRAALGAQRSRIVRQLVVESLLLGAVAGGSGILLSFVTTRLLVANAPTVLPRLDELTVDGTVLAFGMAISLVAALVFGVVPAIQASRPQLGESLKEGARGASGGRARQRIRAALVIGEVALSVSLLIGAGLLIRSFWQLQQVQPGFAVDNVLTMRVTLPRGAYDSARSRQFYERLLPALTAMPGVQSVATSSGVPLTPGSTSTEVTIPGKTLPPGTQASADWRLVSAGFFHALGIPLRGRDFTAADMSVDREGNPLQAVTIISEEMARRYWPGEDVIGKTVLLHSLGRAPQTIIGVAGDVRSFGLDVQPGPMVYAPAPVFSGWNPMSLVIRSAVDPQSHLPQVRAAMRAIDPNVPIFDVNLLSDLLSESLGSRRFNMYVLAVFAVIAVVLACVGLFGVLAYLVAQRTRDLGIRMALGASPRDVFRLVLGQGMALSIAGAAMGLAGGFAAGRLMKTLLFSVEPADPLTLVSVPLLLIGVAFLACYAPARRATRIDPLSALRAE